MSKFDYTIQDNIIELLSSALYDYPVYALREYIQNSYDSIQAKGKGNIFIDTNDESTTISIYDDGDEYLSSSDFDDSFKNFASSNKTDPTLIGHKGIGIIAFMSKAKEIIFNAKIDNKTEIISFEYLSGEKKLNVNRNTRDDIDLFKEHEASFCVQIVKLEKKLYESINFDDIQDNRVYRLTHILPIAYSNINNFHLGLNENINVFLNDCLLQKKLGEEVFGTEKTEFVFVSNINESVIAKGVLSYLGGNEISGRSYSNKTCRGKTGLSCGLSIRKKGMFISDGSRLRKKVDDATLNAFYVEICIEDNFMVENTARTWFESSDALDEFEECLGLLYEYLESVRHSQSQLYNNKITYSEYCVENVEAFKKVENHIKGDLVKIVNEDNVSSKNAEESLDRLVNNFSVIKEQGVSIFSNGQINLYDEFGIKEEDRDFLSFSIDNNYEYVTINDDGILTIDDPGEFDRNKNFQLNFQLRGVDLEELFDGDNSILISSFSEDLKDTFPPTRGVTSQSNYFIDLSLNTLNDCNENCGFLSEYKNHIEAYNTGRAPCHVTRRNTQDMFLNNLLLRVHVESMLRYFFMMIFQNNKENDASIKLANAEFYDSIDKALEGLVRWKNRAKDSTKTFTHWQALRDCLFILGHHNDATRRFANSYCNQANKVIHANELFTVDQLNTLQPLMYNLTVGIEEYIRG